MRVFIIIGTLLFLSLAIVGCISRSGVVEFTAYKSVFDDSAAVSNSILDKLAAGERDVLIQDRYKPVEGLDVDPNFVAADAPIYSNLADPPLTHEYRRALDAIHRYNKAMLAYATGQGFQQIEGELFALAKNASVTLGAVSGSVGIATAVTPYLNSIREVSRQILAARSRAVFREKALDYHDDIIGLLVVMRDGTSTVFPNLTDQIEQDILTELENGRDPNALRNKHNKIRVLLSDWVILMNRNIDALNAVKLAIENPSPGSNISDATTELIAVRSTVDAVRRHLAEIDS